MRRIRKGFEINLSFKRKANKLAKLVGCSLNWKRVPGYAWDGKSVGCAQMDASNVVHEIAHYAVATKAARKTPDYGLGLGPDSKEGHTVNGKYATLYGYKFCGEIEAKASALGIYWEKKLGLPWEDTADYHNWHELDELDKAWKKLSKTIKKFPIKG